MTLARMAFRNLSRHRVRTFFSVFAIAIAGIVGLLMLTLLAGMKENMRSTLVAYRTGHVQIRNAQYNRYDYLNPIHLYISDARELAERLSRIEGVSHVAGRIHAAGEIYLDDDPWDDQLGERTSAVGIGIDFAAEHTLMRPQRLVVAGQLPADGAREVAIGYGLAHRLGLSVGDRFDFMTSTASRSVNAIGFTVSAIVNFDIMGEFNARTFLTSLSTMQRLVQMNGGVQEILLLADDIELAPEVRERVTDVLEKQRAAGGDDLEALLWRDQGEFYALMEVGDTMYNIFAIFFLFLGATVIVNTMMMAVYERYHEIGTLLALGMRGGELVRLFFYEALFSGVIAAVIAIVAGGGIALYLGAVGIDFAAGYGSLEFDITSMVYPRLTGTHAVLIALYTVGVSGLVTLIPCRKAAKVEPVEALHAE